MRKTLVVISLFLLSGLMLSAQEGTNSFSSRVKPFGYVSTYAIFDSREVSAATADLFSYIPYDKSLNRLGRDVSANPSFKMVAFSTNLGLEINPFKVGNATVSGRVDADFYLLNGSSVSVNLREAYVDFNWDHLGYVENAVSLRVGQMWHPMAVDRPYSINYESSAPFNPFASLPGALLDFKMFNGLTISAAVMYPLTCPPTGPSGPSINYVKYGLVPEAYAGVSYSIGNFDFKIGADFLSLKPRTRTATTDNNTYDIGDKVKDRISMISPMAFAQFATKNFKINAKTIYASGGDHLGLMGGYALCDKTDPLNYEYTPLRSTVSYVSLCVGSKWQFMCTGGLMMPIGTPRAVMLTAEGTVDPARIYMSSFGFKNISQMLRLSPTFAYNTGRLTVALEYENTAVQFGDLDRLTPRTITRTNLHWIVNHRALALVKLSF